MTARAPIRARAVFVSTENKPLPEQIRRVASLAFRGPNGGRKQRETTMGIIIWLVIGGICGWLASMIMRTDGQQGIILNVVVGIIGSVIASFIFGAGINQAITITTFIYSLIGAVILLAIVNLVRRGSVR
jgi:uncharacterized membrane protein YeaQ/YmgE (transglycosylase-associated protein family)